MKSVALLISLLPFLQGITQTKPDYSQLYLQELFHSSSKLNSNSPSDINFSDLESIGHSIGESRIVMLGEPSHGDGGAIQMKTRLVKYLHEKKGFDILLFEADLYSIFWGISSVKDTSLISQLAAENIYTCWSTSKVSQDLWTYYKHELTGSNPITIGGIDCRHAGQFSKQNLCNNLTRILDSIGFNTLSTAYKKFTIDINYLLRNEFSSLKDSIDLDNLHSTLKNINEKITYSSFYQRINWLIEINNLSGYIEMCINNKNRDIVMANNFRLIANYLYPGKKIIVWSHNNHNALDVNTYSSINPEFATWWHNNNTYETFTYLGTNLFREYNKQVYSLAITSGSGNYSPRFFGNDLFHADYSKTASVPQSKENSLEYLFTKNKYLFAFIPFPQAQGSQSGYPWFNARLFDLNYEATMDYTSSFNGIIFINKTVDLNGNN